jgi:hypothetical protein
VSRLSAQSPAGAPGAPREDPPAASAPSVVGQPHTSAPATKPGEQRRVDGRVMRATGGASLPLAGAWVVLHRVGADHAAPIDSQRTNADGRYAFRYQTSGDANAVYFATSSRGGVAYFSMPFKTAVVTGDDALLTVFDTTSAPVPIRIRARHLVVGAPATDGMRPIVEVVELSNDSSVTRIAAGDTVPVWESVLLDGARDATLGQADFSDRAVKFEANKLRLLASFAPGLKQLSWSYRVKSLDEYSVPVMQEAGLLEVLIEDPLGRAEGGGLIASGPTTVSGRTFARFLGQEVRGGAVVRVMAPTQRGVSPEQLRLFAIAAAVGTGLLIVLARVMMRRGRQRRAKAMSADELRARLSELDAKFAGIATPTAEQKADHWQARAHLAQQITDAVAREQGTA